MQLVNDQICMTLSLQLFEAEYVVCIVIMYNRSPGSWEGCRAETPERLDRTLTHFAALKGGHSLFAKHDTRPQRFLCRERTAEWGFSTRYLDSRGIL